MCSSFLKYLCFIFIITYSVLCSQAFSAEASDPNQQEATAEEWKQEDIDSDRFTSALLNMVVTLILFIGLIFVFSWILKRMLDNRQQQVNTQSSIKILEKRTLSPKSTLYILDVVDKTILIAESPSGISHLLTLEGEEKEEEPTHTYSD